ncbi:nucleotide exchange factor GrpE [Acidimicrobiales bacterium]|nr:nucleotide exchange factor GrpE [Acidimicrobiaceae bacterium]MDC1390298.1 nucleotide exchange factor GrpE [Acidimicrobiales bacterium]HAY68731.1 nucleotide exchange factor GrpE [Acidimicrobiaceae bacterium]
MGNEHEGAPDGAVPDDGDVIQPAGNQPAGDQVTDEALAALIDEQSAADQAAGSDQAGLSPDQISEEAVVALIAERDDFLDQLQRAKAEFANARRRSDERAEMQRAQAAASLVERLLPVLDSCEAALGQGIEEIRPVSDALFEVLSSQGLERVDAAGEPFDPELHEAVLYEEGEGEQVVVETLRTGYRWNDRVLRAAMVKVQG